MSGNPSDNPNCGIITGQRVTSEKLERARELRRNATIEEKRLWQALRRPAWDGPPFRRQQVIDGFIADFYCHAARLVVELDGSVHAPQADYDQERDRVIRARGLTVLRLTNDAIRDRLPETLRRIHDACRGDLSS